MIETRRGSGNYVCSFDDYELMPSYLKDIESIDLKTKVLGTELDLPFFLSPMGMSCLFHHERELGACRAAHRFGTMYGLLTLATTSLEEVGAATPGPKVFQIYILKDRERDLYNGMTMPPKINARNFFSYGLSFEWLINLALSPDFKLANVAHRVDAMGKGALALIDYVNGQFDRTVTWEDAAWLAEQWDGPFVIKGVQSLADAIGDQLELIMDGGVRRGTHVIKALAQGADACSIGRWSC